MQKTIIAELDIQQALEGIECPRQKIEALKNEVRNGKLEAIVGMLIQHKISDSVVSAIKFLLQSEMFSIDEPEKVHLGDIKRVSSNKRLYDQLDKLQEKQKPESFRDRSRIFGIKGHVAIPALFSRSLKEIQALLEGSLQVELNFETEREITLENLFSFETKATKIEQYKMSANRRVRKIEEKWAQVVELMKTIRLPRQKRPYKSLIELLKPVYKKDLKEILDMGMRNSEDAYFAFLTVMTWATVLIEHHKHKPRVLFTEIALMPHGYDVGFGRIDAIEVEAINGLEPDEKQSKILRWLSHQDIKSVGHLIHSLIGLFGQNISIVIHDWKFCAGDGDNGSGKTLNLIHTDSVLEKPLPKHYGQMQGYLSTSLISYGMVADHKVEKLEDLWSKGNFQVVGRIHYFLPTTTPIVHNVVLTDNEKKEVFREQVVQNYSDAERRRETLGISRKWLKYTIGLAKGLIYKSQNSVKQGQFEFEPEKHHRGKISKIIKDSMQIQWYDEFQTVEHRGVDKKTNDPKLYLHYDRFIDAINQGSISVGRNFDPATGGHVSCYLPNHGHTGKGTPSLHISPKGFFKCYSCGGWGYFAEGSMPASFEGRMQIVAKKSFFRSINEIQAFSVPERYQEATKKAQTIYQNQFLVSPGARYLEQKRKLNPELSQFIGAGYADQRSIEYMFDCGFTYDELIEFGFIGISHKVKEFGPTSTMVELMKKKGLTIDQIQRMKPKTEDGKEVLVPGLPYLVLDHRVTYPMDINHIITHFYGRSVVDNSPKSYAHQKTSPKIVVPQGGFNITRSMDRAIQKVKNKDYKPEIGITEAPIDADTMFQHGGKCKEFGALVGVNNTLLFQILGCFPGSILVAFNWDESKIVEGKELLLAGQKNTVKLVERLKSYDFRYPVYDFTEPFVAKNPGFNDLNGYWQDVWSDYWKVLPVGSKSGSMSKYLDPFQTSFNRKRIL